jgi:glycerol-3-phosphate dehydrogenase
MSADPAYGRRVALERLGAGRFDLLVIGAGILGSRIAYEAASDGLSVALLDGGDFAGATSSASSKLLHGGLRYLSTGDFALVRRLQSERRAIATRIAPHLTSPLPLVLALESPSRVSTAKLNAALALYAALGSAVRPLPRRLNADAAEAAVPALRGGSVRSYGLVTEALTNDARLTLATVRAAVAAGATAANYVRVVELEHRHGRLCGAFVEDEATGERLRVSSRAVVNATGPWLDFVRRLEDPGAEPLVRLSKGVHVVVELLGDCRTGLALFDDSGTAIAIPWEGMLLLGTTDTPYESPPGCHEIGDAEAGQVLGRFGNVLQPEQLLGTGVVHAFSGFRVLARGDRSTARARRRHVVAIGSGGMVSVAGGKLTAHRLIAMDALRLLPSEVRTRRRAPRDTRLGQPCTDQTASLLRDRLDAGTAAHLIRLYGDEARRVLAYAEHVPDALERIDPKEPDVWAQVDYARDEEWAMTEADIVERRTTLAVRGLASPAARQAIRERLAAKPELAIF